jgi:hypothetical protein
MDDPQIRREVLPKVNEALQSIQNEIQAGASTVAPPTASRDFIPPPVR